MVTRNLKSLFFLLCLVLLVVLIWSMISMNRWNARNDYHQRSAGEKHCDLTSNRPILFQSDRDGDFEIFAVYADGSGLRQLTFNQVEDEYPVWSPDAREILFQSNREGHFDIYVMDPYGHNQVRLTDSRRDYFSASWSADGSRIYFDSLENGIYSINSMRRDGSDKRVFKKGGPQHSYVLTSCSPDGKHIAFTVSTARGWHIHILDVETGMEKVLTDRGGNCRPAWSPDGRYIAYVSTVTDGKGDIWTMRADGTDKRQITTSPDYDYCPTWSADGSKIVYAHAREKNQGNWMLYLISIAGGESVPLAHHPACSKSPHWY
ncbi:PD40 domain-containing protein [bacterium]|nr:PD40 domain-containing protein [bacterium]